MKQIAFLQEDATLRDRYTWLLDRLAGFDGLAIAFSGGVDSTVLLYCAQQALGEKAGAFMARSRLSPKWEQAEARDFCKAQGVGLTWVDFDPLPTWTTWGTTGRACRRWRSWGYTAPCGRRG